MLPSVTRRIVGRPLARLYPRLHHQNVAMRSAFLDRAVRAELEASAGAPTIVCVLGGGFDVRPLRMHTATAVGAANADSAADADGAADTDGAADSEVSWAEIDLPHVVAQKRALLSRLVRRRPALARRVDALASIGANLTNAADARRAVHAALAPAREALAPASTALGPTRPRPRVVFVAEALLIYLPSESAARLLSVCVEEAEAAGAAHVAFAFADRLPAVDGCAYADASAALAAGPGLVLDEDSWLPKPGLARHMGVARATFPP